MANNDPVSGLMSSMTRVRSRRPEGLAQMGEMAAQAGTIEQTQAPRVKPPVVPLRPFEQYLQSQVPQATPAPQPAPEPMPTVPSETASMAPQSAELPDRGPQARVAVTRVANSLLGDDADLDLPDAYMLALGYLYGVRSPATGAQSGMQVPPANLG
jgi:hypothetical protein